MGTKAYDLCLPQTYERGNPCRKYARTEASWAPCLLHYTLSGKSSTRGASSSPLQRKTEKNKQILESPSQTGSPQGRKSFFTLHRWTQRMSFLQDPRLSEQRMYVCEEKAMAMQRKSKGEITTMSDRELRYGMHTSPRKKPL